MSRNGPLALAFNALFVLFMAGPLIVVIGVSFTPEGFLEFPPSGISLRWFRAILENEDFIQAFWISLYLGLASATLSSLIAVPAALAIGRYRFTGREPLVGLFMSPLTVPTIVLGIAFLRFLSQLGINGTFIGLVLCHAVIITPYVLRLTLASVTGLDRRTEWAAV
jgi:putative spermidine/putrescine transport system permease protein